MPDPFGDDSEYLRYDERDNVFSRRDLIEEEPDFIEYYASHPELLEVDRRFRAAGRLGNGIHPADFAMFNAPAWLMTRIGAPEVVDGTPSEHQIKLPIKRLRVLTKY